MTSETLDGIYISPIQLCVLGFDYQLQNRTREYKLLNEIADFAALTNNYLCNKQTYLFFTSLSVKNAKKVFDDLGIIPETFKVSRRGIFKKQILVRL